MGIACETVEVLQLPEDGQVDLGTESALEFVKCGFLGSKQVLVQDVGAQQRWSRNLSYR